jgi:hypothetical protein
MENWLDHEWRPPLAAAESNHTQSITQIKTTRLSLYKKKKIGPTWFFRV